jgi:hypothetical protein
MLRKVYRDQLAAIAAGQDPMGVAFSSDKELVHLDAGTAVEKAEA